MFTRVFWKRLLFLVFVFSISHGYVKQKQQEYDYIVVGGGTAGCVIASRLSEDPDVQVLLLEAGVSDRSVPAIQVPAAMGMLIGSDIDWGFYTEPLQYAGKEHINQKQRLSQAKVLGGCSSHNNIQIVRGSHHDFDRWRDLGNKGWGYKDVLHYFKKFENMQDPTLAKSIYHGTKGPVNIVLSERTPLTNTFINAGQELGYNEVDYNGKTQEGFSIFQINTKLGRRQNAAESYIWSVMGRRNLHVKLQAMVTKITIKNNRAVGVEYIQHGHQKVAEAQREVIVTAGTLNTPKVLMLSGIGPRDHLEKLGIPVVKDLPVGLGLDYHMAVYLDYFAHNPPSDPLQNMENYVFKGIGPLTQSGSHGVAFLKTPGQPNTDKYPYVQLFQGGGLPGATKEIANDTQHYKQTDLKFFLPMYRAQLGKQGVEFPIVLNHPRTRGTVTLKSKDPLIEPRFTVPALKDEQDIRDLLHGIRTVQKLTDTTPYRQLNATYAFPQHPGCTEFRHDSDEYWTCFVRHKAYIWSHLTSTCKMAPDETGVVDNNLRVKGISGLRVADASVMPQVTSGNTMAVVIMIAEKASDIIKLDTGYVQK